MLSRAYLAVIQLRTSEIETDEEIERTIDFLRRLADSMEYFAIYQKDAEPDVIRACAFVAAESLALLADYYKETSTTNTEIRIRRNDLFTRLEAAILYLFSEFDACAAGVLADCPEAAETQSTTGDTATEWCFETIKSLCEFRLNPYPSRQCPVAFKSSRSISGKDLEDDTAGRLYAKLGESTAAFMYWLGGDFENGLGVAVDNLSALILALQPRTDTNLVAGVGDDFARIYHLAVLLKHTLPNLGKRALMHIIPMPPDTSPDSYKSYLKKRAIGTTKGSTGRPVLWPSAHEYVRRCLHGNAKHAVVSMPTGSGKSFVAELAISQNIGSGWCLYLAPTNALAEQIRADLRYALHPLDTQVVAFIGDREYSTLSTEAVMDIPPNTVAVMTPEKCSLALRLQPDAFRYCRMVVFDECQLIAESTSGRGITAELVISQIMLRAESCRFLLMSAIVQNPEDLSGWLGDATGQQAEPITVPWRPTRTLRSALGIDYESASKAAREGKQKLDQLSNKRKSVRFNARYSTICGLQGAWQPTGSEDYAVVVLPCDAELKVRKNGTQSKTNYEVEPDSWVNGSALRISGFLAERDIQTLTFLPASKHYPFSVAKDLEFSEQCKNKLLTLPDDVEICRVLAEYEFGMASQVFAHLDDGIAVHTSHMLETEKIASEIAFRNRAARVMFATGTLAQGLNLPAMAVVIAGTRIGYPRGEDAKIVEQRKLSQLLNAAGRAGRAGFANQGFVIAIPDKPVFLKTPSTEITDLHNQLEYLRKPDNAVIISSGLDSFLDQMTKQILSANTATEIELQTIAVLSGGDESQPSAQRILKKSFAAYRRRQKNFEDVSDAAAQHLENIRRTFVSAAGAPAWLPIAAQRSGLGFFLTLSLSRAWARVQQALPENILAWTVPQWIDLLLRIIAHVPPGILLRQCLSKMIEKGAPDVADILEAHSNLSQITNQEWSLPDGWLNGWLNVASLLNPWINGEPLVQLASIIKKEPIDRITPSRNAGDQAIPQVISLINDFWATLSILAGGLVAIAEQLFKQFAREGNQTFAFGVPLSLNCLPMCIKYGFNSPQTLAWFRFGIRLRRPAHLLATSFPPPNNLQNDEQLRDWVREQRRKWLNREDENEIRDEIQDEHSKVFAAIYSFITKRIY